MKRRCPDSEKDGVSLMESFIVGSDADTRIKLYQCVQPYTIKFPTPRAMLCLHLRSRKTKCRGVGPGSVICKDRHQPVKTRRSPQSGMKLHSRGPCVRSMVNESETSSLFSPRFVAVVVLFAAATALLSCILPSAMRPLRAGL